MKNHLPLAKLQKKLLGLIKNFYSPLPEDEAYFHQVAQSPNLQLVKDIALWWRQNHLERYCFFTSRFLKSTGQMEAVTAQYYHYNNHSSFIEEIGPQFLKWLSQNSKGLTSAIARFEAGMMAVNKGEIYEDEIMWPCDPLPVIHALINGNLCNESIQEGRFRMIISDKITSTFEVEEMEINDSLPDDFNKFVKSEPPFVL